MKNKRQEENDREALNCLLKKSAGDIDSLTGEEVLELQRLCTKIVVRSLRDNYVEHYPGLNPLAACLREEPYRRRITQQKAAELLGMSAGYYSKIVSGKQGIGSAVAKRIYKTFAIDGNFILENI
jgi:hypothetical protein